MKLIEKKNANRTLADVLPAQDHYYLISLGDRFARHGWEEANGLLVFLTLEQAEEFCRTVAIGTGSTPARIGIEEFLKLAHEIGAICLSEGLKVEVCKFR